MIVNSTGLPRRTLEEITLWVRDRMPACVLKANFLIEGSPSIVYGFDAAAFRYAIVGGGTSRGLPAWDPLVKIEVGTLWRRGRYPQVQIHRTAAGAARLDNWREHLLLVIAHELRHVEQMLTWVDLDPEEMEIDAERWAIKLLEERRSSHDTGRVRDAHGAEPRRA